MRVARLRRHDERRGLGVLRSLDAHGRGDLRDGGIGPAEVAHLGRDAWVREGRGQRIRRAAPRPLADKGTRSGERYETALAHEVGGGRLSASALL